MKKWIYEFRCLKVYIEDMILVIKNENSGYLFKWEVKPKKKKIILAISYKLSQTDRWIDDGRWFWWWWWWL